MYLRKKALTLFAAAAIAVPMLTLSAPKASAGIVISVGFAPPALPVYAQPPIPGDGYIWTPGYWAYGDAGYYWVPGTWVLAPQPGYLWTPAYWGFEGGVYGFHEGYWGPHVGYYGGINYGFGYGGIGFFGGEWRGGHLFYNTAVINFGGGFHSNNVYVNRDVIVHNTIVNNNHVAFSGPGGVNHSPSPEERQFSNERHIQPTAMQQQHFQAAAQDRSQLASVNHGRPTTTAAASPAAYHQVAEQHAHTQPISTADRSAGKQPLGAERPANSGTAMRAAPGVRSEPAARADVRPAPETRAATAPRAETRPAATPRAETRPAAESRAAARPAAAPKAAPKPAPKTAPQEHEDRPHGR